MAGESQHVRKKSIEILNQLFNLGMEELANARKYEAQKGKQNS